MTDWATTILAASIAAAASIVAANISSANSRRNMRGRILQELEIADKLPEASPAKAIMRAHAEKHALLLPIEDQIRHAGVHDFAMLAILMILFKFKEMTHRDWGQFYWVILIWGVLLSAYWLNFKRNRHYLIVDHLAAHGLPPIVDPMPHEAVFASYRPWLFTRWWKRRGRSAATAQRQSKGPETDEGG